MTRRMGKQGGGKVNQDGNEEDSQGGIVEEVELDVKEDGQAGRRQGQVRW